METLFKAFHIFILASLLVIASCKQEEPAPALAIVSIKSGGIDLSSSSATKISVSLPIVIIFSTKLDAATVTSDNIILSKGVSPFTIRITVAENTVIITPVSNLSFGESHSLTVSKALKSDKGIALSNPASLSFTTDEPNKVYFSQVIATPTDLESITLKNNFGSDQDISNWTIGDADNPMAYKIPVGTLIKKGEKKSFSHTILGFAINDSGETLYLRNTAGIEIDKWSN